MRNFHWLLALFSVCLVIGSCADSKAPENIDTLKDTVVAMVPRPLPDCNSVYTEVTFYELCNGNVVPSASDTIRKYRLSTPYHQKCDTIRDSLHIQFDINLNCAVKCTGDACATDSVLFVGYYDNRTPDTSAGRISIPKASCDCIYRFVYKVPNGPYKKLIAVDGHASTRRGRGKDFYAPRIK
jgi:hypothetical protein